jgi:protein CMS1
MGDVLDEDQYLLEEDDRGVEREYLEESGSGSEDSDRDEEEDDENHGKGSDEVKKRKRSEKFAELKAKRRKMNETKQEEEGHKHIVQEDETEATMQLQPEEMLYLVEDARRRHRLVPEALSSLHFEVDNFFYPAMETKAVTESTTKKLSPFIRALSTSLPNYRKLLAAEGCTNVASEDLGSPLVVIVTASAIRATEIIQGLNSKIHHCKLAKLFGKHIKITEQIEILSKSYYPIVIGTPHRLHQLAELGALSLNKTQLFFIDFTADSKTFTILTLPGVNQDFGKFLFQFVHPNRSHVRIALIKDKPQSPDAKKNHTNIAKKNFQKHQHSQRKGTKQQKKKVQNNASAQKTK